MSDPQPMHISEFVPTVGYVQDNNLGPQELKIAEEKMNNDEPPPQPL